MEIEEHYGHLLGVESPWQITSVDLKMQDQRIDIVIENSDNVAPAQNAALCAPSMTNEISVLGDT